eukprot:9481271-Pyramimonas_sp.AAC.2
MLHALPLVIIEEVGFQTPEPLPQCSRAPGVRFNEPPNYCTYKSVSNPQVHRVKGIKSEPQTRPREKLPTKNRTPRA